ncbi:MAG: phytase [Oculatellaceae cyanobacterium bins.114]|nr:phytase [Oculatellaceae cyanobacterium bins.114]
MSTNSIRFAQFNASLNRGSAGQLVTDLSTPSNAQARTVAEIIQRNNPDVLLINEFDYVEADPLAPVRLFQQNYLSVSQNGAPTVEYPYVYIAPSNTGVPSGLDLDNNGSVGGPNDAFGFGFFPGQFGMVLFSKYPIDTANVRTFQEFLWRDMPGALLPDDPTTPVPQDWYSPTELEAFRLSSKSHWDVPIQVNGETIHALVSHPTPPVFDGPEDRNGTRNHDEIRFWADYVTPGQGSYIYDDNGNQGGLATGSSFVIMGDQNADPLDGDSTADAILQLLDNPYINTSVTPENQGGPEQATLDGGNNLLHDGNPRFDTADFGDTGAGGPGNLRADYVLPSANLEIADAEVFWPLTTDPLFRLVGDRQNPATTPSSDHSLVWVDVVVPTRQTVADVDFLGEVTFPTSTTFNGTQVGGLSGITYDAATNRYYSIADDRSQINPARFYTLSIDLSDGELDTGDVDFETVTTLLNGSGVPFPALSLDPEGIGLSTDGTLYISSEGDANAGVAPFVNEFSLTGQQLSTLPIPNRYLPTATNGIRNNLAFESLTISPDGRYLYTATENALKQDGPAAGLDQESLSRILKYDLTTGALVQEYVYVTEPVADQPVPAGSFSTNGLVDLLAIDTSGTLLALERSFSNGVGNTVKLFEIRTQGALDVSSLDDLFFEEGGIPFEIDPAVSKRELLDFADLGLTPDNLEGITFGPRLADGRQSLIVVSDNNFASTQTTQFIALALDLDSTPVVLPEVETAPILDTDEAIPPGAIAGDGDDPAIWVHPTDPSKSLVITALKDGGLAVFDLDGDLIQSILPADYGDIRYNNVDLTYGFRVGSQSVDLAIASDRENDTLAIYQIDSTTRQLSDITSSSIPASIFGLDDGEQTAYGLATYTSPVTGKSYVFVTQREGDRIAQLELTDDGTGKVSATVVRTLTVPIPSGGELEDAQTEGMVVDRELGFLYVAQENVGIWKFSAEPTASTRGRLIDRVRPDGDRLEADAEGLTIYYGANGTGYLLASSQGDSRFAAYTREGNNDYIGDFAVGASNGIDSVEESDGADVINVPLGPNYPFGLLVVHDGANDPQVVAADDEELENISTNFKFVPWQNVATAFPEALDIDPISYNPRNPVPSTLPNGVASGDTTQTSTVLWTRSTVLGRVTFEYSTDPNFRRIAGRRTATVTDPLNPVKVTLQGLTPGTDYYYRVTDAAGVSFSGDFTTSARLGTQTGFRFGVSGDWRGELAPYPAISNADDRDLELFVMHGDTIYSDYESPVLPGVDQARTLEEYRLKHSEVYGNRLGENTFAELRRTTSILATIDDHEVINDFAGGAPAASDPRFGETSGLVNDTQLYENGLQAFQDYNPVRNEFYGATGDARTSGERRLYRYNTYGSDAATFILDARSFRDAELPGVANPTDPAQVGAFLAGSYNPSRTMLGRQQVADLKRDLLDAEADGVTWKFIMVPEPIQNLGIVGAGDRFEGYAAERTEILRFINENNISNVVFVAADIHGTLVNNLTYQESPLGSQIATNAFEISTGSVAFDAPFGQTVSQLAADLGLLSPAQKAFYDSLPIAPDADALPNDRDDFVQQLVNQQLSAFGYDPLGLNNNLAIANGRIDATLLQGDYVASHTYGWTEFDINPTTQKLIVTTYGIPAYSAADLAADPGAVLSRVPTIVSQFEVDPAEAANTITGTNAGETLRGTAGSDRIYALGGFDTVVGGLGNDLIFGGKGKDEIQGDRNSTAGGDDIIYGGSNVDRISGGGGNDRLFGEGSNDILWGEVGDDLLRGGAGNDTLTGDTSASVNGIDTFVLAPGEGTDTIRDFQIGEDRIGLAGGLTFAQLAIAQQGSRTVIRANDQSLAVLLGVNAADLIASAATSFTAIG